MTIARFTACCWSSATHPMLGRGARRQRRSSGSQHTGDWGKRWVVERTPTWLNRFRRILVRWEKTWQSALGFLRLACAIITHRQAGLLGQVPRS